MGKKKGKMWEMKRLSKFCARKEIWGTYCNDLQNIAIEFFFFFGNKVEFSLITIVTF